jgi:hypothetical protein
MTHTTSSRSRRGWVAALNTALVGGLGYLVLGASRELAVLVLLAAGLGILLEWTELS